ncbi:NAD(P)H-dependent flavin oxidoreductase [Thermodesulfobacteriota bacterium]
MFKTRVTEILGIEHPLIVGTMGSLTFGEFVAAVAEAGAFCCIPSVFFDDKDGLRDDIRKAKNLTDKPFGVNVNLFPSVRKSSNEDLIDVCIEEGVKVIETSGRSPKAFVEKIKGAGMVHMHKCARARDAVSAEKAGVDLVEIVGTECGGHPSMENISTTVLLPRTVDLVDIPVIGGGGFGDARGFIACLALGAEGVLMGTRFMLTKECGLPDIYKNAFAEAPETSTEIIQRSIGNPSRVFKNKAAERVLEAESQGANLEELMPLIRGDKSRAAIQAGDLDNGIIACGQVTGIMNDIPTIKEAVDCIINGAREVYDKINFTR